MFFSDCHDFYSIKVDRQIAHRWSKKIYGYGEYLPEKIIFAVVKPF